jgi:hypothetical protein
VRRRRAGLARPLWRTATRCRRHPGRVRAAGCGCPGPATRRDHLRVESPVATGRAMQPTTAVMILAAPGTSPIVDGQKSRCPQNPGYPPSPRPPIHHHSNRSDIPLPHSGPGSRSTATLPTWWPPSLPGRPADIGSQGGVMVLCHHDEELHGPLA